MVSHFAREPHAPANEPVREVLAAANAPTEPGPVAGEDEAVAAFTAAVGTTIPLPTRRNSMRPPVSTRRIAVLSSLAVAALLTGSVSAASAGVLPDAAQGKASDWLARVGVQVPGSESEMPGDDDEVEGEAAEDEAEAAEEDAEAAETDGEGSEVATTGKGEAVSRLAHDAEPGPEHGVTVSEFASDGKSQAGGGEDAGRHGDAGSHGRARANAASAGHSDKADAGGTEATESGSMGDDGDSDAARDHKASNGRSGGGTANGRH